MLTFLIFAASLTLFVILGAFDAPLEAILFIAAFGSFSAYKAFGRGCVINWIVILLVVTFSFWMLLVALNIPSPSPIAYLRLLSIEIMMSLLIFSFKPSARDIPKEIASDDDNGRSPLLLSYEGDLSIRKII